MLTSSATLRHLLTNKSKYNNNAINIPWLAEDLDQMMMMMDLFSVLPYPL